MPNENIQSLNDIPLFFIIMSSNEESIMTMFDDQEIPYTVLNNALSRLIKVLDEPLVGKETFPPVKQKKEHIDFLVSQN